MCNLYMSSGFWLSSAFLARRGRLRFATAWTAKSMTTLASASGAFSNHRMIAVGVSGLVSLVMYSSAV